MVVRSDSHNSPTTSAAADQPHGSDASSSALITANVPLEPPHNMATGALSRLRSLKASLEKMHVRRSARDTPATMEAIGNVEKQLAALSSLRDVCARIDQRLARAEAMSGPGDGATIDAALRDACTQIYDRLTRVEAAIQRTEGSVADKPWDLAAIAYKRLERVEESLRLTQRSIEDSTLPEMCVNIERQIIQTRQAVQRTEEAVADTHVRELCASIDARLVRTEDSLRRTEGIVAEWLRALSVSMTTRFADAEETIQRIEQIVSSRTVEQTAPQQSSVQMDSRPAQTAFPLPWMVNLTVPVLAFVMVFAIGALIISSRDAAPEKATPEKVVSRPSTEESIPVAPATTAAVAIPSTTAQRSDASPSTREEDASPPTRQERVSTPQRQSPDREPAPIASRPQTFVGTLSITSVPSGASVSLNGKVAGVTPLRLPRQRAGSLAVQIAQDGFERWSAAVRVPADRLTEVTARLRPVVP
jgi:PEGA domain